jgi:regulatory protein
MKSDSTLGEAKAAALRYILYKKRTVFEVRTKLETKDFGDSIIQTVIAHYSGLGYLDDELYAVKYVKEWKKMRHESFNMLKVRLRRKGINEAIIDNCLHYTAEDEKERIVICFEKKYGFIEQFDITQFKDVKFKRKFYGNFLRKGFSTESVRQLFSKISEEL